MPLLDPYKQELHASGFRAIIEVASELLGHDAVAEIVAALGLKLTDFSDPEGWLSLHAAEALVDAVTERLGDAAWLDRAMRLCMSPQYLGIVYPLMRSLGTPALVYKQLASIAQRLNKTTLWSVDALEPRRARLSVRAAAGVAHESRPHMCRARSVQLAVLPAMFDLPPAVVAHPQCMSRGDDACVYELSWQPHRRPLWSLGSFAFGAGIGVCALLSGAVSGWVAAPLTLGLALGGWGLGRVRELRGLLRERMSDLQENTEVLARNALANEARVQELLSAKSEVEQRVEQRTEELRLAMQRLAESLSEIQQLDRAKTDFFNNVSHELRSPLTMIIAPLEEMVAGRAPPGGDRLALQAMHRNATRLLRLINQLLDLAKIDAGEMQIHPVATDLGALVQGLVASFEPAARGKRVALELSLPAGMLPIHVDPAWIESAVTNLVANALRLTPPGKGVRVSVQDEGAAVILSVADDGPGIAPADHKKVFERFAQGDSGARVIGGTGIGLALVREAARLHGGEIALRSALGEGATFTLNLPRRAVSAAAASAAHDASQSASAAHSWKPSPLGAEFEPRVDASCANSFAGPEPNAPLAFVVDDNPELREFVALVLASRYRVQAFGDAREVVKAARRQEPAVVVSDVAMPEMNGYELCRALRGHARTQSIPILLVTARTDVASVLEGFDAGASDYVLKPFHGRELLARVDVHVRLQRMVQEMGLRERHAMLGVLSASIAHQVRNPLTTLVSGLPAMRQRLLPHLEPSTAELIQVMMDCAGRIERITGDLMDLSRLDREANGAFRPSDGLRSAIRIVQTRTVASIQIEDHVLDAPLIQGKAGDLNHVFMNLLDNAIRAVERNGRIRVDGSTDGNSYVVRIGDSGPGIDEETAAKVFEPFFTTRQAGEGSGLGLSIALQVMRQCGGDIAIGRSELGGAEFRVDIPLLRRPSTPLPALAEAAVG